MFKFLKTAQRSIQKAIEPKVNVQETIEAIHHEFDTAGENLLKEAKKILASDYNTEKGERLKSMGFVKSKSAVDAIAVSEMKVKSKHVAERVEYYQIHYPNYKFITSEIVEEICKKYGLLCSDVSNYIGDVPAKNLEEIEKFILKDEEKVQYKCGWFTSEITHSRMAMFYLPSTEGKGHYGYVKRERWGDALISIHDMSITSVYEQPPYQICAPVKDFDTTNMRITEGYKLEAVPDPIVLQPVHGGYLIVSKWGLEASDELLVNEKSN